MILICLTCANLTSPLQDQWGRKKQTKTEARAAKLAKLDPANSKSAKDVLDETVRKRKREEGDYSEVETGVEKPLEGLRRGFKKQKKTLPRPDRPVPATTKRPEGSDEEEDGDLEQRSKSEKRQEKRQRQKARREKASQKAMEKKERKKKEKETANEPKAQRADHAEECGEPVEDVALGDQLDEIDVTGLYETPHISNLTASPSSERQSPVF